MEVGPQRQIDRVKGTPEMAGRCVRVTRVRVSADKRRPRGEQVPSRSLARATRVERVEAIKRAESKGQTTREIAASLGLAASTIRIYRRDPDGEAQRARHARYQGRCRECGKATSGSRGAEKAPEWCAKHAPRQRRRWSDEQILAAIRKWQGLTGAPPILADWSPAHAPSGHEGAARYLAERGAWPSASAVIRRFGSLDAAVKHAHAGF